MKSEIDMFEAGTGSRTCPCKDAVEPDGGVSDLRKLLRYGCLEMIRVSSDEGATKKTNFTIDYILGTDLQKKRESTVDRNYDWLNYTRYRPPKLQS